MVLVRIVFHGKFGHARVIVDQLMKSIDVLKATDITPPRHVRVLTDLSGQFDTIIEELEFDNLDQYLSVRGRIFADPAWQETMRDLPQHVEGGSQEYFTVEYEA